MRCPKLTWKDFPGLVPNASSYLVIPHPISTTAAIVVSRRCFICQQLSILHPSCRRVCGGGRRLPFCFVKFFHRGGRDLPERDIAR
jgi:hypothetical protein